MNAERLRGDRGQVGGIEALPFGVLLFVVGGLLVANAWAVIDAKMAVTSAAREAARTYVESTDPQRAYEGAVAAARDAIGSYGRDPTKLTVPRPDNDRYARCEEVTFEATYPIPAITLPWIGGFGETFHVTARHTEIIDPFRDGVPGEADPCF